MAKKIDLYQETFELPSRGLLYKDIEGNQTIPSSITLRSMTVEEDKLRFVSSSFIKTMSQIIAACTVEPADIKIEDLLSQDFMYLMYMLRLISFGNNYKVTLGCPDCEKEFQSTVDLSDLKINYLDDDFKEPISIKLPVSGDEIGIKLMRISDMLWVERESKIIKKKFKDYQGDPQYVLRLESYIKTINGEVPNSIDKRNYVSRMNSKDAAYIMYNINKIEFGIDSNMIEICPSCGEEVEFSLPFNEEFFRPSFDD